jgi:hypothetical protein
LVEVIVGSVDTETFVDSETASRQRWSIYIVMYTYDNLEWLIRMLVGA